MGKVRDHIYDDTQALAQWVFRKLKNHDPMSVRELPGGNSLRAKMGVTAKERVMHQEGTTECHYVLDDGRVFEIRVTQTAGMSRAQLDAGNAGKKKKRSSEPVED